MMQRRPVAPAQLARIDPATQRDIVRAVRAARPIGDLVAWMIAQYPEANRAWAFAALKAVYEGGFEITPASRKATTYRIGSEEFRAYPQRLA